VAVYLVRTTRPVSSTEPLPAFSKLLL
jgi:hypothetical protein